MDDRSSLPDGYALGDVAPFAWDNGEATRYEVAVEMLTQQVSAANARLTAELAQDAPDQGRVDDLHALVASLTRSRRELRAGDAEQVQRILSEARARVAEIDAW
jgi:hypothetical protein